MWLSRHFVIQSLVESLMAVSLTVIFLAIAIIIALDEFVVCKASVVPKNKPETPNLPRKRINGVLTFNTSGESDSEVFKELFHLLRDENEASKMHRDGFLLYKGNGKPLPVFWR